MKKLFPFSVFLSLLFLFYSLSSAEVPQIINYQGKLTNASGAPVNDTLQMVFTIYSDTGGTNLIWTETQSAVVVEKGVFNVLLGSVDSIPYSVFDGSIRYLGVKVGGDPEITPRKQMVSVGYAFKTGYSDTAEYARTAPAIPDADWTIDGDNIYHINGNVGIGTTSPNEQLEFTGNLRLPVSTASVGVIKSGADRFIHNFGTNNFFAGVNAGNLTTSGVGGNTGVGWSALKALTAGNHNTAVGSDALSSNTTGWDNTAVGQVALFKNTTGSNNMAVGIGALYYNTTGWDNSAVGQGALFKNTTGHWNTAVGPGALYYNTTGSDNTAVGFNALISNTTGSDNTAIGYQANVSVDSFTNATAIGANAVVDASNKVRIGNTDVTSIGGQVGWTNFSDGRYKKNVSQNVPGLAFISKLKPVTFTMDVDAIDAVLRPPRQPGQGQSEEDLKLSAEEIASKQAKSQIVYTGFIAQEVEQAAQETGYDFSGVDAPTSDKGMYGLRYAEFVVPLVKAVQEQQQMIQEQQQIIQNLQKRIEELEKK